MVVVAAGRHEGRAGIVHHHLEAELVAIEGLGARDVADAQMDMAHHRTVRHAGIVASVGLAQQGVEIEPVGCHLDLAARPARPFRPAAVAIDLDAVALWIGKVERFADEVIRGSFERQAPACGMAEPVGEIGAGRQQ